MSNHSEIWDNFSSIRTQDVEGVIILFLNRWRCRLPRSCARELTSALKQAELMISPLRKINLEEAEMLEEIKVSNREVGMLSLIEDVFGTIEGIKAGPRTVGFTATSKMLHMAVPSFFVMSDEKIREHYGCEGNACGYANFMLRMNLFAKNLVSQAQGKRQTILEYSKWPGRALTRLLDNYNYTMFTLDEQRAFP